MSGEGWQRQFNRHEFQTGLDYSVEALSKKKNKIKRNENRLFKDSLSRNEKFNK